MAIITAKNTMEQLVEILAIPFMQRALLAGVVVALVCSLLGIFSVIKRMTFFGDAIGHASLAGIAFGVLVSVNPLIPAFVLAVILGLLIYEINRKFKIANDVILGFFFSFLMAVGVILINITPGYQPELMGFLFGNILTISQEALYLIVAVGAVIIILTEVYLGKLIAVSFDEVEAKLLGIPVDLLNRLLFVMLSAAVIISIKLVGITLVNGLLIIPAATAQLVSKSLKQLFILSPILAVIAVIVGLLSSYFLDIVSGPAIVVVLMLQWVLVLGLKQIFNRI